MKKLLAVWILAAATVVQAGNVTVVNPDNKPVPVTIVTTAGGTAMASSTYAAHITTSTTTTATSSTAYLNSIVITTTNAGTTWALKIQNKEGTPKAIYNITAVVAGTVSIPLQAPLLMTSGIDIITTGATPGVVDVFLNYAQ